MSEHKETFLKDKKQKEQAQLKLALILCGISVIISLGVILGVVLF